MKKLVLMLGMMVVSMHAFAASHSLDPKSLIGAIRKAHATTSEKGSFAIVYGGQDISSRSSILNSSATLVA